jgi:hypothetical protein
MAKSNAKFIAGMCIYAFLIFFFIAMAAWIIQENLGNATMLYVGIVPAALAVVFGLMFYRFIKKTIEERRISSRSKFKFGFKQAVFLIIFLLSFMPFVLPLFDHGLNLKDHSIYNPTWSGCSGLKDRLESQGYDVQGIQSSLSTTMRNNDTYKVIVMLGPNRFYNPLYDLAFYLDFFNTGGSLLICDDKGSTNYLMMEMSLMTSFKTPFVEFPKGDLADNASYIPGKDPYYPVIQNFVSHPTTSGVSRVALNYASAIISYGSIISSFMEDSGSGMGSLGTELITIGSTSESYSFIDMNHDRYYDPKVDVWDSSIIMEFLKAFIDLSAEDEAELVAYVSSLLLGALPKTVFGAQNLDHGRLFVSGDASLFNNQLLNDPTFDNALFADNIFSWLSSDGTTTYPPENVTVYFDEVHIRPEGIQEFSSAYIYGMFIGYVNWLSSSAILAWIYPFMALYTLSRWLPPDPEKVAQEKAKKEEKEKKGEKEPEFRVKFGSETAFVKKIKSLREGSDFNEPVLMLYRRVLRRLNRLLGDKEPTPDNIIPLIKNASKKDITAKDDARLRKFFDTMDALKLKSGRKIDTEDEFKELFFEMTWVADWLNINIV